MRLNEIVLEDVRADGQWWGVIRSHLKATLPAHIPAHSPDRDGYDAMLEGIRDTLGRALDIATGLMIEDEYNEGAWKHMISLYYVENMRVIRNTVTRVHLFIGDQLTFDLTDPEDMRRMQAAYLGYFNIRPVWGDKRCVSYVMLNYDALRLSCRVPNGPTVSFDLCTYRRSVHLGAAELFIHTFPFFGRDDKLVVCAQADLLMMSRYIYRRLGMPELTLKHICRNRSQDRLDVVPTRGISDKQMMEIFHDRDINIKDYRAVDKQRALRTGERSFHAMGRMVEAMLDSGLPALIILGEHVVIANGISEKVYSANWKDCPRKLTLYDDSGALLKQLDDRQPDIPFLGTCAWNEIVSAMDPRPDDIAVIVPFFIGVTMDYFQLVELIRVNLPRLSGLLSRKRGGGFGFDSRKWNNARVFLISCTELKKQLARVCADGWDWMLQADDVSPEEREYAATEVELQRALCVRVLSAGLPHYYWCLEIPAAIPDTPRADSDTYLYYLFDSAPVVADDIEATCVNCVRKGDKTWRRLLERGNDKNTLRNFFARYKTEVIAQPFSLRERIEANG